MLPNFLIPETVVRESGTGPEIEIATPGTYLLVTLGINRILEQQSLDIFITGSTDGVTWNPKPLVRFPQKFYCGTYSMVLDLTQNPEVKFLRAEYKVNRWGRGETKPLFGFYVFAEKSDEKALVASQAVA